MLRRTAIRKLCGFSLLLGLGVFLTACNEDDSGPVSSVPAVPVSTSPSRVAITVDDLPYVTFGGASPEDGLRYSESIVSALGEHGIVATGFVIGRNINAETRPALQAFADAGHMIGNHSWSHPDYGNLTPDEFLEETRQTDEVLAEWIDGPKYYRFPYLRQGETAAKREAAIEILTNLGYQNVPVTIDNDEWQFNADYTEAMADGDTDAAAIIGQNYLAHMQERTSHFQTLAVDELGGDVDHILLVHLNQINADHLGTLLDWYEAQGWTFITVDEALAHPVFSRAELYEGPRGLSQIERILGGQREQ
ncbi:polysaccharide deacetylase family protein [Roseobacter sp. CCS2]|uniref:polysaccharide deacetylase family protein n=1 Tax=Roseobacter sp. CCS2 TaxID=391593 RepID=UPI0002E88061|nr:polysaccharide deacetylase family protein [Roseobacter sp. CCS2]